MQGHPSHRDEADSSQSRSGQGISDRESDRTTLDARPKQDPGFGVYIHWPFCRSKCPYCDFNSHVRDTVDQVRWREALLAELAHYAGETPERRVSSIFFGGGTPSLMAPETAAALIAAVKHHWPAAPELEVTLEANPTSVEAPRFAAYADAGVNRVSLGVQALNDRDLSFLGREHDTAEAMAAVALARGQFQRVSFDLIYARPGQTPAAWAEELRRALGEGCDHLSLYQLTIEQNTAFHARARRGELPLAEPETAADLFEATQNTLAAEGLPAYEISNHARPGEACRHNLTYWRGGDYLGIGPGAHGRITRGRDKLATRQHRAPEIWLATVEQAGHATRTRKALTREDRLTELLMMGLRLQDGIDRTAFHRELGREPEALLDERKLKALAEEGYLVLDAPGLRATAEGRARLNSLLAYLIP
ncbi:radical SAM family heme chaperone HemW [Algihabitans albus]|uniref:radical SAM family heme chaperone HemW n=1 Tax=Algihabitans albus TaxID=2164067 RepID=UPI002E261B97